MCRGPPDPSTGLAESGVAQEQPNCDLLGSTVPGIGKSARLNRLKNSVRNWALYRSLNFHILDTEKSTL